MPKKKSRKRSRRSTPSRSRRRAKRRSPLKYLLGRLALVAGVCLVAYVVYLDVTVRRQFEGKRWSLPAHVYTRPMELYSGLALRPQRLVAELRRLGYREQPRLDAPGSFRRNGATVEMHARPFIFWDGPRPAATVRVSFDDDAVAALADADGRTLDLFLLEPRLFGSVSPIEHEDRSLVRLDSVPDHLIAALLAVEDRNYFDHIGIDPRGLARAVWANLRARDVVQGGSTLTQQLVKNFYLSSERTLRRKLTEMVMALLLELHYDKDEILETYINEVYLGQAGHRAIHGFGLASQFYFGRPLHELKLAETTLLVALVRGASYYNPRRHPQRAVERRNLVLQQMVAREYIVDAEAARARAAPLGVATLGRVTATAYPAFLDFVRRQLRNDYREADLRSEGLRIFTTLDPDVQALTERALEQRLDAVERSRRLDAGSLEAAALVVRSDNGEVLAMVGGREARFSGFNRALDARRPIGSLVKPAVYLTALESKGGYSLATVLEDEPLTVKQRGSADWQPQNYDRKFHGNVLLVEALAHSYNVPTARLGLELGVADVANTMRRLGVASELPVFPSLLLGAPNLAPVDMAQMYLTFASGGFRMPLKTTRSVLSNDEQPLARYPLSIEQVIDPAPMMLLNYALQEVVRTGTARSLGGRFSAELALAGKTGTTDGFRDSWFAGYSGNYLAVVWVGRDDNQPTGLTGASGAMQIWADVMSRLDLAPLVMAPPEGVDLVAVDSWGRQAFGCANTLTLPFIAGTEPTERAPCARGEPRRKVGGSIRNFFKRLFKGAN